MNILIVGEYSAFAKHLKHGFVQLGHKVTVVTNGDGFKKLEAEKDDIKYSTPKDFSILGKRLWGSHRVLNPFENRRLMKKVDCLPALELIIVVNAVFVSSSFWQVGVALGYIRKCKKNGTKIILSSCGDDPANHIYYHELKYFKNMFPNGIQRYSKRDESKYLKLIKLSDIIIPTSYEYYYCLQKYLKDKELSTPCSNVIPVPITIENVDVSSCKGRKIFIFHGIIRSSDKGTPYFVEALERIKRDYSDKAEVIIDGKKPYNEYLKLLQKIDVLLDNTNSYDMGVNSNLGLMYGKVVLSGNEPEAEENMALGKSPVINAKPDVDYLYDVLKDLVLNSEKVDRIKQESRDFAVKHLDANVIAKRYLALINK